MFSRVARFSPFSRFFFSFTPESDFLVHRKHVCKSQQSLLLNPDSSCPTEAQQQQLSTAETRGGKGERYLYALSSSF